MGRPFNKNVKENGRGNGISRLSTKMFKGIEEELGEVVFLTETFNRIEKK